MRASLLMRNKTIKTALAATSLALMSTMQAGAQDLPEEQAAFARISRAYHFQLPETPRIIGEYLASNPGSNHMAEAKLMLADWYFYNHEFPLALRYYSEIPEGAFSGDTREGMIYRMAFSRIKTGYYNEAAKYFKELSRSSEYGEASQFYLAYIDYVNGRYDDAYKKFKNLKGRGGKSAEAEYYLNQIDYLNGEYRKVAVTSERLLSTGEIPDELRAETMRVGGLANFKTGAYAMARSILNNYVDLTGDGAEISALYALGTIYYDEGDYAKALRLFTPVTEYPGELAQSAWLYIGQIYSAQGDQQAAALAFDKAAKESWDKSVAETAAYNMAVSSSSGLALPFADSVSVMESFIETYPSSPYAAGLSSYLANAYYGRRDYENALRQIDKIKPATAESLATRQKILYQQGGTLLQQGKTSEAIKALADAEAGPDREVSAQAGLWLGDAYYAVKDYSKSSRAYERSIATGKLGANTALAWYNLGYALMKTRDYRKAENAFKEATSLTGLTPGQKSDARLRLADCLYYNGKYQQALAMFRDIKLEGGSESVFARIREADILGKDGKVTEKISILEALADNPDAGVWRPTIYSRLADAYSEKGDDRKAAELYMKMLDSEGNKTDQTQTYYSLATNAENLYASGEKAAAYSAYRRLEQSGIAALYPAAVTGIMRTSENPAEIREYAARVAALPGISAEDMNEANYLGSQAALGLDGIQRENALAALRSLALSSDRQWGARAAVTLGEEYLRAGDTAAAEEILLNLADNGSDDNYWLARGYITLADVYMAQDKDYLARLYLETLQSNYPGKEKEIRQMINQRLNRLQK